MKHNNDFKYDLIEGVIGEKHLAKILKDKSIEVKTDFEASETGNVFVEYESRGNKSGIAKTHADYYAFLMSNEQILLIEVKRLKEICRSYLGSARDVRGGDKDGGTVGTSKGIILPITELLKLKKGQPNRQARQIKRLSDGEA